MKSSALYSVRYYWLSGILAAALGVILARAVAPALEPKTGAIVATTGQVIALAGLVVICFGVRRRVWQQHHQQDEPPQT